MVSARQEIDLRPQLERLDALILRSAGLDPAALTFAFRPLWQLSASEKASVALSKAQASQVYAGLSLWPADVTARLVEAQLVEDGTYPGADGVFAEGAQAPSVPQFPSHPTVTDSNFDPAQPRDPDGKWTSGGGAPDVSFAAGPEHTATSTAPASGSSGLISSALGLLSQLNPIGSAQAAEIDPEEENRHLAGEVNDPAAEIRIDRYYEAWRTLKDLDPTNSLLNFFAISRRLCSIRRKYSGARVGDRKS